jgi:hypothetical protein
MFRELTDGGVVEQVRQFHDPRIEFVDLLVDLQQREGTRADVEQVLVHVDVLARQGIVHDGLELLLQPARRRTPVAMGR